VSIWHWRHLLPTISATHPITLGEGDTPVVRSRHIGPQAGLDQLWFKLESVNPTGSYKDRFAAAAIAQMLAEDKRLCIATSSGNTGSALAAYCAAADIRCRIAIVETARANKLNQMLAYGAEIFRIKGFGIDPEISKQTFAALSNHGSQIDVALQISAYCYSPVGMAGVQTISYELADDLEEIDHVFVPAGGGGLTLAIARAFGDLVRTNRLANRPRVHCVQPSGNDTIAGPLRKGLEHARQVDCTTEISGLQVPIVLDGNEVIVECRASGGTGHVVEDDEVFAVQKRLAREEGLLCEPAAAVSIAGALQAMRSGEIAVTDSVVCIVTGSGFKDQQSIETMISNVKTKTIDYSALASHLSRE
jgi:threonine synthase